MQSLARTQPGNGSPLRASATPYETAVLLPTHGNWQPATRGMQALRLRRRRHRAAAQSREDRGPRTQRRNISRGGRSSRSSRSSKDWCGTGWQRAVRRAGRGVGSRWRVRATHRRGPRSSTPGAPGQGRGLTKEQQREVDQHNRDFAKKHDHAGQAKDDEVDKKFWKGRGSRGRDRLDRPERSSPARSDSIRLETEKGQRDFCQTLSRPNMLKGYWPRQPRVAVIPTYAAVISSAVR